MTVRGQGWAWAALALLSACSREAPSDQPSEPAPAELAPPVAPPSNDASTEVPIDAPSAEASAEPALPAAYPPRDECAGLPGFAAFRTKVFAAAKARDADALATLADAKINLDFGGGSGPEELRKRLADPKSGLWEEIAALRDLGCAHDRGVATMPWIFARLPETYADGATAMYGTGPTLSLRARPASDARLLARLTWPVVELEGPGFDPQARFARVRLSDGTIGYMETARLRSLLDYRLIADRQGGEWKITALIAGD